MPPDLSQPFEAPRAPMPSNAEDGLRLRLRRNRLLATSLLLSMVAIFLGTHLVPEPGFAVRLLRAAAEAGIVGGLADWFAVTALFRHPLGLPIPHTAIVPTSKERIGQTLGRFLERHFLTEEVLVRKLRSANMAQRFATWLAAPSTAPVLAGAVVSALPYVIRTLDNADLQDFARRSLGKQVRQADIAPVMGRAIDVLTASGETDVLFERALGVAAQWLEENREQIFDLVRERSRWWIPRTIDRKIADAIVTGSADLLNKLREPDSDVRLKFREALHRLIDDLINSPEQREQINAFKNRLLEHPELQAWIAAAWHETSRVMLEDLSRPNSKVRNAVERICLLVGRALAADETMLKHIDALLERLAAYLVSWRHEIGTFVSEVVRSWDTPTLVDRLELVVGSDLQYIRMNGTIVGALAGCFIFLVSQILG
ncbi:uncharacterized membrane-anchored protein YjiN (DUF445 family) [Sinorhizobium kostiense]|uniref:Uncharacterized membrane-anchored protein YjiN (DUF445 family) n=1 Tax=Sinorhizobium kostiense TaxID=76747 RepID=A0ABS4R6N1_9HYPH|nr:DUF445 domain-containing protein [Sinorhizobium kostiense]MBP2238533.1 uncharacterized membrane-anchored protein YjiN (DUF445 family) [Sinorhizobium kostiense]